MTIIYTVWMDRNRDGVQTSDEIITSDVLDLKWRLGMAQPYDTMAPPGWAEIVLDARSGAYTGANAAALLGCCITLLSSDGITTRTHFVGFVRSITPVTGSYGARTALLKAYTRDAALADHVPTALPEPINEAKALIRHALVGSGMPYRVTTGYAVLDAPGSLASLVNLFDDVEAFAADTGLTPLAYGGAWKTQAQPADAVIAEVVESERGRFYCGRDGTLFLRNRHFLLRSRTSQFTCADTMSDLVVSSGSHIINDMEIQVVPRRVGAANSLLWSLPKPLTLAPGQTRRLQMAFHDEPTQMIGALEVSRWSVTVTDQSGLVDMTASVGSWLSDITLSGAVVSLRHNSPMPLVLTSLALYGTPLFSDQAQTVRMTDMPSVMQVGRRSRVLALVALSTLDQAEDIARYEIGRRKMPQTRAVSVTLTTDLHAQAVLERTLYDCVTVSETHSLPEARYVICAEEHHVQWGTAHQVTWLLEPVDDTLFACVGSVLDGLHMVAY